MPDIILKINTPEDKIYTSDHICCYWFASKAGADQRQQAAAAGKLVLVSPDIEIADSDGVVVSADSSKPLKAQIRPWREKIGSKKALGVIINPTRHEAMLASETEPEFVAFRFGQDNAAAASEVIKWYNELFLIQSAVDLSGGLVDIRGLDVDFVIINSSDYDDFSC